jgi:hypothetical protein
MKTIEVDNFQIVAFTTNETSPSPNDIIKIFLDQHTHIIKTQSQHAISCEFSFDSNQKKIMMITIPDINRTYQGISDVSFYFFFVHLESLNVQNKFQSICSYIKKYCDLSKKIFIFGIIKDDSELIKNNISYENFKKILDEMKFNYIYNEVSMVNKEKIGKIFLDIFLSFSQKRENMTNINSSNKNEVGRQAHSCVFY